MSTEDPRRRIPRTDQLLAHPRVQAAGDAMSERVVRDLVRAAQDRARLARRDAGGAVAKGRRSLTGGEAIAAGGR